MYLGDFNVVLNLEDIIGFVVTLDEVAKFKQCLRDCYLREMGTTGPYFTWSNKQKGVHRA